MKFLKESKFRSLLLAGVLSLSLFFGGCSSNEVDKDINSPTKTEQGNKTEQDVNVENSAAQDENSDSSASSDNAQDEEIKNTENNSGVENSASLPEGLTEANVVRVVDGDTVKVNVKGAGNEVTLRLLLIDTPESVKPGVSPQPYSIEASNFAKDLLKAGDTVYLEYDDGDKTDKYDRHLCYLWYYSEEDNDWKMYNEKVVEEGLARVGYIYSQRRHLNTLYAAQDKAKGKKINIWSVPGYVTDNGFDVDASNGSTNKNNESTNKNTSSESGSSDVVYANGGSSSSNKYHSSPNAHGMKGAIKMKESEAISKGYKACGLCY